jgi:DNA-directed RNA polymerase subunit RPC12/RpoP
MMSDDAQLTCKDCGTRFFFLARERQLWIARGWGPPVRCPACRRERKARRAAEDSDRATGANSSTRESGDVQPANGLTQSCADCGQRFYLEPGEIQRYEARGWPLPRRCVRCRKTRRVFLEGTEPTKGVSDGSR